MFSAGQVININLTSQQCIFTNFSHFRFESTHAYDQASGDSLLFVESDFARCQRDDHLNIRNEIGLARLQFAVRLSTANAEIFRIFKVDTAYPNLGLWIG
ncbi:hypothetical protein D3C87_1764700 [compost metagenome]